MGVIVSGGNSNVAGYYDGLRVIDLRTPSAPIEVGFYAHRYRATVIATMVIKPLHSIRAWSLAAAAGRSGMARSFGFPGAVRV